MGSGVHPRPLQHQTAVLLIKLFQRQIQPLLTFLPNASVGEIVVACVQFAGADHAQGGEQVIIIANAGHVTKTDFR